jgi:subtilisin-like proprotein convertase family protein
VKIQININHPYDSDLQAYLISPAGTRVQLFSGVGESGANFQGTIFDDDASTSILDGEAPFTGSFRPSQSLSAFEGQDTRGIWTLEVSDHFPGDEGTLLAWTLAFNGASLHASGANTLAVTETRQTFSAPTNAAGLSTSSVPNEHSVQSKALIPERNAASTQSTLQPEINDLLLSTQSFSHDGAERIQSAAAELRSASKKDSGLKDSIASDDLIAPDFRSFEQI